MIPIFEESVPVLVELKDLFTNCVNTLSVFGSFVVEAFAVVIAGVLGGCVVLGAEKEFEILLVC